MSADRELYSPDVQRRYLATIQAEPTVLPNWPAACGGAANAFLVLVGPSMGGARRGETPVAVVRTARTENP